MLTGLQGAHCAVACGGPWPSSRADSGSRQAVWKTRLSGQVSQYSLCGGAPSGVNPRVPPPGAPGVPGQQPGRTLLPLHPASGGRVRPSCLQSLALPGPLFPSGSRGLTLTGSHRGHQGRMREHPALQGRVRCHHSEGKGRAYKGHRGPFLEQLGTPVQTGEPRK